MHDYNLVKTEKDKMSNLDLAHVLVVKWNVDSAIIVPIVVSAHGLIPKSLDESSEALNWSLGPKQIVLGHAIDYNMSDEPECQLRRRRSSANSTLPLSLDIGYQIDEGNPCEGTPSPSTLKKFPKRSSSSALLEFKNKQQSFDIQVEECEEEEIIIDTEDEEGEDVATGIERAVTPTPFHDFGANVVYTEGPQATDFLRVKAIEADCYTDVSDADTSEEE